MGETKCLTVHWDSKLLSALVGRTSKVDRLAVLVSYDGIAKLLGAPIIPSSSGENCAIAVHKLLTDFNILDRVKSMSFDTTSSNTGNRTGACLHMKELFDLDLLRLPCRKHINEVILRAVFELKMGKSSAPEVPVYERFAAAWKTIDKKSFKPGHLDAIVDAQISDEVRVEMTTFCRQQLNQFQPRRDYKELLELALMFLGSADENFVVRPCGPTSHARFMAKVIYSLKIFIFRDQFNLSASQLNGIRDICIFLIHIFIKTWYVCANAISAPRNDHDFVANAIAYAQIDSAVSKEILRKISSHLWYLSPQSMGLAFFDPKISIEQKQRMVKRLDSDQPVLKFIDGRKLLEPEDLMLYDISELVTSETKKFFERFEISLNFVEGDPSEWASSSDYMKGYEICKNLFVVNDTAERGVKFMQDYNRGNTLDEQENQFLLQVVESYRKKYPTCTKSCLVDTE